MKIDYDHVPFNFLGLDPGESAFGPARAVILPVAYDHTCSYGTGTRHAPLRVIEASRYVETWDEELHAEPRKCGIHTLPVMEPIVSGPADMIAEVQRVIGALFDEDKVPILLGGEHSLSVGAIRAAAKRHENLSVLHLDAHADLRDSYQGSEYSHACMAARAVQVAPVLQIGVRSLSPEEVGVSTRQPVTTVTADAFFDGRDWKADVERVLTGPVYLTLDVDVFDPSVLPSTGTPEPGGLSWRDVLAVLRFAFQHCTVVGFDVVEHEPQPGMTAYDFLVARLIHKMIGYRFAGGAETDRRAQR